MREGTADEISSSSSDPESLPGVFLMTNSLETGGSERQFLALSRSLDPRKFRLLTACIMRKGPMAEMFTHMPEFRLGGSLYGWRSLLIRLRLARHLRRNCVDVAHAFDFYTNLTMIPAARLSGVPVVIGSQRQLGDLLTSIQFRVQSDVFRMCDAIVCNSKAAARGLANAGIRERNLFVIGNGLAPELFAQTEPLWPRRPGLIRIGMIARMNTHAKRHSLFLQAAARLRQKCSHVEFVLAGDGP